MADQKISALTGAATPLAGTEVLPIVQSGATVKVATNDLTVRNFRANATTGILQVTGPAAASTRVATVPDANFTVARTDAAQTFTGNQRINGFLGVDVASSAWSAGSAIDLGLGTAIFNPGSTGQTWFYTNAYFNAGTKYKAAGEATWYQQVQGAHNWYGSAAGVNPGDPITFIQNGGLDNSGNMSVKGNFVPSTAAKGVNFTANTPAAGMTSQLLNAYEEGTWTPNFAPSGGSFAAITQDPVFARYTRIGRMVYITAMLRTTNLVTTGATGYITITGLPFTVGGYGMVSITRAEGWATSPYSMTIPNGGTSLDLYKRAASNGPTAISAIADLTTGATTSNEVIFFGMYST